ncbi:UNKNOWN [Stylonychia lemnae]|uniref:Uncharacterized protein n=1 Tax=Stylonychia lemnae TaxID=5949 RepID=A0A078B2J3_STYLE|nr:UNKNOWN [Stylonychia lemnae]|eukprot:CDW88704.1 UNKNOWN [Stylonychia lemnae]
MDTDSNSQSLTSVIKNNSTAMVLTQLSPELAESMVLFSSNDPPPTQPNTEFNLKSEAIAEENSQECFSDNNQGMDEEEEDESQYNNEFSNINQKALIQKKAKKSSKKIANVMQLMNQTMNITAQSKFINDSEKFLASMYKQLFSNKKRKKSKRNKQGTNGQQQHLLNDPSFEIRNINANVGGTELKTNLLSFQADYTDSANTNTQNNHQHSNLPMHILQQSKPLDEVQEYIIDESTDQFSSIQLQNTATTNRQLNDYALSQRMPNETMNNTYEKQKKKKSKQRKNKHKKKKFLNEINQNNSLSLKRPDIQDYASAGANDRFLIQDKYIANQLKTVTNRFIDDSQNQINSTFDSYLEKESDQLFKELTFQSTQNSFFNRRNNQQDRPQTLLDMKQHQINKNDYINYQINAGEINQLEQIIQNKRIKTAEKTSKGFKRNRLEALFASKNTSKKGLNNTAYMSANPHLADDNSLGSDGVQLFKQVSLPVPQSRNQSNIGVDREGVAGIVNNLQFSDIKSIDTTTNNTQKKSTNRMLPMADWNNRLQHLLLKSTPKKNCFGCIPPEEKAEHQFHSFSNMTQYNTHHHHQPTTAFSNQDRSNSNLRQQQQHQRQQIPMTSNNKVRAIKTLREDNSTTNTIKNTYNQIGVSFNTSNLDVSINDSSYNMNNQNIHTQKRRILSNDMEKAGNAVTRKQLQNKEDIMNNTMTTLLNNASYLQGRNKFVKLRPQGGGGGTVDMEKISKLAKPKQNRNVEATYQSNKTTTNTSNSKFVNKRQYFLKDSISKQTDSNQINNLKIDIHNRTTIVNNQIFSNNENSKNSIINKFIQDTPIDLEPSVVQNQAENGQQQHGLVLKPLEKLSQKNKYYQRSQLSNHHHDHSIDTERTEIEGYRQFKIEQMKNYKYHERRRQCCQQVDHQRSVESQDRQYKSLELGQRSQSRSLNSSQMSIRSNRNQSPLLQQSKRKFVKLVQGKIMVGSRAMSIEDFHKMRDVSQRESQNLFQSITTKANAGINIQEEEYDRFRQSSPNQKNHQESESLLVKFNTSIQTDTSFFNQATSTDWTDSQLYQNMIEENPNYNEEELIQMVIEQELEKEDEQVQAGARTTLFYHYKKSRKIYSQIECEYHANILKKKLHRKDHFDEEHLYDIYFIALKTLGALMTLLMLYPQWKKIERLYGTDESQITVENCIKVLVRAKKMYEARTIMIKIIKLVIERESLKKKLGKMRIEQPSEGDGAVTNQEETTQSLQKVTGRILSQIANLQEEHKIFKRPFIMNGMDYLEELKKEFNELQSQFKAKYYLEFNIQSENETFQVQDDSNEQLAPQQIVKDQTIVKSEEIQHAQIEVNNPENQN